MANGWAPDGAVQEQIDDTITDAVKRARVIMPAGKSPNHGDDCGKTIPKSRRNALQGVRTCVGCQSTRDANLRSSGINRRGSKDSQLR
jgi:RNA polymerase-binding transcription factor DksA